MRKQRLGELNMREFEICRQSGESEPGLSDFKARLKNSFQVRVLAKYLRKRFNKQETK